MALLSKEQILAAADLPETEASVPAWGGSVRIRSMTALDREAWEESCRIRNGDQIEVNRRNMRARFLAVCLVDAEGKLLFSMDEAEALAVKNAYIIDELFEKAQALNKITDKHVEDLAKNSPAGRSADSASA